MRKSRIVFGFGIALAVVLLLAGLNNLIWDRHESELVTLQEEMIVEKEGVLYFISEENSELQLEMPRDLLKDVVYGNPHKVTYSYNVLMKKGHVLELKVT